jgi:ABC-type bacteriocin/lantibiotic exporter with double-glycine peptidase domain
VHQIYKALLAIHSAGLGHDAVIEILIALLGVMVAVLALIGFIISVVVTVAGWYGYTTIRREAVKAAKKTAHKVAMNVATDIGLRTLQDYRDQMQASELSERQTEDLPDATEPKTKTGRQRFRATNDRSLREERNL